MRRYERWDDHPIIICLSLAKKLWEIKQVRNLLVTYRKSGVNQGKCTNQPISPVDRIVSLHVCHSILNEIDLAYVECSIAELGDVDHGYLPAQTPHTSAG